MEMFLLSLMVYKVRTKKKINSPKGNAVLYLSCKI